MTPPSTSSPALDPVAIATGAQRVAADPTRNAWVTASAGSGKTKVLVDRVLRLLLAGTQPHALLCLTFTKAAAAEMASRLRTLLSLWAISPDDELAGDLTALLGRPPSDGETLTARGLFAAVLDAPGGLRIQTLHGFCQSLLGRFPLEAGIAPGSEVLDDRMAADLLTACVTDVLLDADAGGDAALTEARDIIVTGKHEINLHDFLTKLLFYRARISRMLTRHGGPEGAARDLARKLGCAADDDPDALIAATCADAALDREGLSAAATALGGKTGEKLTGWLALEEPARIDAFDAFCNIFLTKGDWQPKKSVPSDRLERDDPAAASYIRDLAATLCDLRARISAVVLVRSSRAAWTFMAAVFARYAAAKAARAALDYEDLIEKACTLLTTPGQSAWVLYKLDGGIDHVLVDEAQDTSPEQWTIVRAITEEFFAGDGDSGGVGSVPAPSPARTLFAVGDAKQSIYSFQGADAAAFAAQHARFRDRAQQAQRAWSDVPLNVSFRSTGPVLRAVDETFTRAGDGVLEDGQSALAHLPRRTAQGGRVEFWPPVLPEDDEEPAPWSPPADAPPAPSAKTRLAGLIARQIAALLAANLPVDSRGGRPLRGGDVLVLVRTRGGFVADLVRMLKQLGVAVAGVDRMVLTEQIAVMDLIALGNVLLLPEDDLTLATVLRSPLCDISEDDLFTLAHGRGKTTPLWQRLAARAGEDSPVGRAHAFLESLLDVVDFLSPHDLYARVLGPMGGRARLLARLGVEAEDPIAEFIAATLDYERQRTPGLQGFLHWLTAGGQTEIKRDLEQGDPDAVRIMTVHGAKGLQAPVVFLPDTMAVPRADNELMWLDDLLIWRPSAEVRHPLHDDLCAAAKDDQLREYRRLLYVAMTRAEDRLYICGAAPKRARVPETCWYEMVLGGLTGIAREDDSAFLQAAGETETHRILVLEDENRSAITAEATPPAPADLPAALPVWATTPAPADPDPVRPLTPSRPAHAAPPTASPTTQAKGADFLLRGTLIHRLLQSLPDMPATRREEAGRTYLDRAGRDLPPDLRAAMLAETLALLDSPVMAALLGPGSRAEVSLTGEVALPGGGHYRVAGQIDRLCVTDAEVIVADYKTNRPPPDRLDQVPPAYLAQMAAYRALLEAIYPQRTVRALLVFTATARVIELPADMLDTARATLAATG